MQKIVVRVLAGVLAAILILGLLAGLAGCKKENKDLVKAPVAAGYTHTLAVTRKGNVLSMGSDNEGERGVDAWTDIVAVSGGAAHSLGLKSDGTVVAVGNMKDDNRCAVDAWMDIKQISAGLFHSVGLKSDGTVLTAGDDYHGQSSLSEWTDIVAVSAGYYHTVGLKSDGTVVAKGWNEYGQCNVSGLKDVVARSLTAPSCSSATIPPDRATSPTGRTWCSLAQALPSPQRLKRTALWSSPDKAPTISRM